MGANALGASALGASALGASALGASALGASALGASALGASAFWLRSGTPDTSNASATGGATQPSGSRARGTNSRVKELPAIAPPSPPLLLLVVLRILSAPAHVDARWRRSRGAKLLPPTRPPRPPRPPRSGADRQLSLTPFVAFQK